MTRRMSCSMTIDAVRARSHGYANVTDGIDRLSLPCRRIEWRYVGADQ